jgi:hypothetical protein
MRPAVPPVGPRRPTPISKSDIDPYIDAIEQERRRLDILPADRRVDWKAVHAHWCDHGRRASIEAQHGTGPYVIHIRQSAALFRDIADILDPDDALNIVAACYLLSFLEPARIRSDDSFDCFLVNRLKARAGCSRGFARHGDPRRGGQQRSYPKEMGLMTRVRTGKRIRDAIAGPAIALARRVEKVMTEQRTAEATYKEQMARIGAA